VEAPQAAEFRALPHRFFILSGAAAAGFRAALAARAAAQSKNLSWRLPQTVVLQSVAGHKP